MDRIKKVYHWILLFLFWGIMAFIYFFNNHIITLMAFLSALIFPIISIVIAIIQSKRISVDIMLDQAVIEREHSANVRIVIHNRTIAPCSNLALIMRMENHFRSNDYTHHFDYYVRGNKECVYCIPLKLQYSGSYRIQIDSVNITDYLGLITKSIPRKVSKELLVMPHNMYLNAATDDLVGSTEEDEIYEVDAQGNDYSEIKNIRDYQAGDKLQTIHWKLSAKEQKLMVKEFSSLTGDMYQILLENDYSEFKKSDLFLDVFYSLANILTKKNIYYSVSIPNPENGNALERIEIKEQGDIIDVILKLYYMPFHKDQGPSLDRYMRNSGRNNYLMVTTKPYPGASYHLLYHCKNEIRVYQVTK